MGINGELLQLSQTIKNFNFLLQVTQEFVSGITSYVCASERAMKLKVRITKSLSR